ncbi:MAG: protein-disulfide reductase DsbD [Marinobacter sp.]|uniref:protein-disulfide reductase DsbD n=1 Tax=Marinobacter sp. TaxID=50741 RepID=UPI00299DE08B|nr:protein-disulfide reductase DsbD [Marinobacter sp.]MDX1633000.1 protein-disulfide reductase DsbD [Marinobacter sp.]
MRFFCQPQPVFLAASATARWLAAGILLLTLLLPGPTLAQSSLFGGGQSVFLPVDQALPFSYTTGDDGVVLRWDIEPGHYLYRERISVTAASEQVDVGEPVFSSPGVAITDEYFGDVTVFFDPVEARVAVTLPPGIKEAQLSVTYQGCAKAGLCYPPQTREVLYYGGGTGATAVAASAAASPVPPADTSSATGLASFLSQQSLWVVALVFLALGLGLTFTPCVLPMVPIISALVSSRNTRTTGHALLLAVSYVLGMALTYAAAGVVTGLLGASFNLQAHLQSPWVLGSFAVLFVLFALAMFNVYDLQLPAGIRNRLNDASQNLTGGRVLSVFVIGAVSALVVSPCVSAPLAGSLLYISTTQDAVAGGISLFALGLGMGIPLILVAVGGRRLLPATGPWMNVVKAFYGVMLLAVAIWLVERLVPAWLSLTLWGLLVAIVGVQLGAFDQARQGWPRTWKGLGLVAFAYGLALLAGAMGGATDPLRPLSPYAAGPAVGSADVAASHADFLRLEEPGAIRRALAAAADRGQPVMLDFYADWCISCKVMERQVFSDPAVIDALAPMTLLQLDMTDNTPEQQALLNELGLFGPPAILFYRPNGDEVRSRRVLGEMDRDQFLAHLAGTSAALAL